MIHLILPEPIAYQRALCQALSDQHGDQFVAWFATSAGADDLRGNEKFRSQFLPEVGYLSLFHALKADADPLVILGGWSSQFAYKVLMISALLRVPILIWADHPHPRQRSPLVDRLRKTYLRFLGQRAAAFLACGRPTIEHLSQLLRIPPEKIFNFPYWVDLPPSWSMPDDSSRPLRVITIARQVAGKRLDVVIEAVALANQGGEYPLAELVMVGDGPERAQLTQLAQDRGLGKAVRFTGWLENRSVCDELRKADVLIVPSAFEAYSVVVLEALAQGRPVLASDQIIAAIDKDDGSGAIQFHPVGDSYCLAGQIRALASNRVDLERRARAARMIAEQWPLARANQILDQVFTTLRRGTTRTEVTNHCGHQAMSDRAAHSNSRAS